MTARISDGELEAWRVAVKQALPWARATVKFTFADVEQFIDYLAAEREHTLDLQAEVAELQRQVHEANARVDTARAAGVTDA